MQKQTPRWLWVSWCLLYPGTLLLMSRQVYEQTYLTWREGPQMVGFSFVHLYPALFVLGASSYFASFLWLLVTVITLVLRRLRATWVLWSLSALMLLTLALDAISTETWQRGMHLCFGPAK